MTFITIKQFKPGRTGHILKDYMSLILIGEIMNFTIIPPTYTSRDLLNSVHKFNIFQPYNHNKQLLHNNIPTITLLAEKWNGFSYQDIIKNLSSYSNQNILIILKGPYRLFLAEIKNKSSLFPHLNPIFDKVLYNLRNCFYNENRMIIEKEKRCIDKDKFNIVIHCRRGDRVNSKTNIKVLQNQLDMVILFCKKIMIENAIDFKIYIITEPTNNNDIFQLIQNKHNDCIIRSKKTILEDLAFASIADLFISSPSSVSVWASYLNPNLKLNNGTYHYHIYDNLSFNFNYAKQQPSHLTQLIINYLINLKK